MQCLLVSAIKSYEIGAWEQTIMHHGFCEILINKKVAGQVEYRFGNTGMGSLWIGDDLYYRTLEAKNLSLRINDCEKEIIARIATPGEAIPFVFKDPAAT